jgi:methylated-DNA-[protein]-cysteine S-methyltransferase
MAKRVKIDWSIYTPFEQRVLKLVQRIPKGTVLTYGDLAKKLGNRNLARAVGRALSQNQHAPVVPCHRVVGYNNVGGYSAQGGIKGKVRLLRKEGYIA